MILIQSLYSCITALTVSALHGPASRREKTKRPNGSHCRRDLPRRGTPSTSRLQRQGSSSLSATAVIWLGSHSNARRAPLQSPASLRQWTRQPCRWQVVAGDRHPACTCVASLLGVIGIPVPPGSKSGLAASRKGWATAAGRPYRAASSLFCRAFTRFWYAT